MVISSIEAEQPARVRRTRRARAGRLSAGRLWVWFYLPALVFVLAFFVLPFLLNVPFAFSGWSSYNSQVPYVGFDNFASLLTDGRLTTAVGITLAYALIAMIIQNTVAISLALSLQRTNRVNTVLRSIFFIPVLISPLAAGYIWRAIVAPDGPLNGLIATFVPGFDFAWLGQPATALATVAFVDAWKWSGLATLVYIAGLNSIPASLLEAAALDGASPARRFWSVQFPLLAPAFTFNIATTLIGALSAYDIIASTTSGGPGSATTTLNVLLQQEFRSGFYGSASAIGLTVTVVVVAIAIPLVTWLRRREVAG